MFQTIIFNNFIFFNKIECSSNINLKNIKKISNADANIVSIGSVTHCADAFNLSLLIN